MQHFNYHSHTSFQNVFDGKNTADEMIAAAEAKGFTTWGISNHCIYHPSFDHLPQMGSQNFSDIKSLIDIHKQCFDWIDEAASRHKIKVLKGLEVDFFPSKHWRNNFEKLIKELKPDCLIGATHFIRSVDEQFLCNIYYLRTLPASVTPEEMKEWLHNYWQNIILAIQSGYFDFMAHIDYCSQFNLCLESEWNDIKLKVVDTLAASKSACEINTGGLRRIGRPYPDWWLVKEMIKEQIPLLISDDSHRIEDVGSCFTEVEQKLLELGCQKRFSF